MRLVALVSSGIDSPVATYLLSKNAEEIILLHADNRPFTDDREIQKFEALAKYLSTQVPCTLKAILVPHGQALQAYKEQCNNKFTCVFCKRMMLRYAEAIAQKENAEAIVMGDSLGQVASQTLQNLRVVEQAVRIIILRPLIGFDKEDTIKIAKQIGTFDLSIAKAEGCGAVPVKPSTQARLEQILAEEQKIDIERLVRFAVMHATSVKLE
jgi:thiamine biosynthesis protein ThiI